MNDTIKETIKKQLSERYLKTQNRSKMMNLN